MKNITNFAPETMLKVSSSPHVKSPVSTTHLMLDVIIALMPALIWSVFNFGLRALNITVISVLFCVLFEYVTEKILHRKVTVIDLSAVVTGIILAMNLPVSVPLWMPVVGAFFAIVVVKQLFGGIGKNVVNPALAARVFLFTCWSGRMTAFTAAGDKLPAFDIAVDAVASATPLAALKNDTLPAESISDLLFGNIGGSMGEVSALLIAVGGLYLIVRKAITWHIPVAYIGTVAVITYLFSGTLPQTEFMLAHLLSGGLIFGAVFMATDYVTCPMTNSGRLIYGVGCGLITVFIRYFGGYPEGTSFAILIMNLLVWYIDRLTKPRRFGGASNGK